jgi:hypothetical protein
MMEQHQPTKKHMAARTFIQAVNHSTVAHAVMLMLIVIQYIMLPAAHMAAPAHGSRTYGTAATASTTGSRGSSIQTTIKHTMMFDIFIVSPGAQQGGREQQQRAHLVSRPTTQHILMARLRTAICLTNRFVM